MTRDGAVHAHASVAVVGEAGVLVRGPSGAGKTRLVLALVARARRDGLFARLVADDRAALARYGDRVVARPHPAIAGLVERRFVGVCPVEHEPACVLRAVVDLVPPPPEGLAIARHPSETSCAEVAGVALPLLRLPAGGCAEDGASLILHQLVSGTLVG